MKWTDKITVTCEDNMELMARYPDNYFDLAIVDPPYGINAEQGTNRASREQFKDKVYGWDNSAPDESYYKELMRVSVNQILNRINHGKIHPTQKPVKLYEWLLDKYAKEGDKILDTHLGSGSIAIACHYRGFELTACELDQEYYDAAHKRFKEQTKQLKLC